MPSHLTREWSLTSPTLSETSESFCMASHSNILLKEYHRMGKKKWGLDTQSEALVALIAVIAMTVALELWGYYVG